MRQSFTTQVIGMILIVSLCIGCIPPGTTTTGTEIAMATADTQRIMDAYEHQLSDVIVDAEGIVERTLSDDLEGSRHQRFILRLSTGITVLVSHNIDLAPRIKGLRTGDEISLRGEYEWNDLGGIIHWTHHDPHKSHPDGWILHKGQRFE